MQSTAVCGQNPAAQPHASRVTESSPRMLTTNPRAAASKVKVEMMPLDKVEGFSKPSSRLGSFRCNPYNCMCCYCRQSMIL